MIYKALKHPSIKIFDYHTEEQITDAVKADTDKGTLTIILSRLMPDGSRKVVIDRKSRKLVTKAAHTDFVIRNKDNEKLYSCHWSKNSDSPPRLTTRTYKAAKAKPSSS